MKNLKRLTSIFAVAALMANPAALISEVNELEENTNAYEDGVACAGIAPGIALSVIAGSAVIGVIINLSNKGNAHSHFHSHASI